jgi:hypothetical protein
VIPLPDSWSHDKPAASLRRNRRRILIGFLIVGVVLALAIVKGASAAPTGWGGCWFACKERHPIGSQYPHGICRTVACEVKKRKQDDDTGGVQTKSNRPQAYPCAVNWVYSSVHYWHYRYGPHGPYGRNHVGVSPLRARHCL